jgi:hypothetical protein
MTGLHNKLTNIAMLSKPIGAKAMSHSLLYPSLELDAFVIAPVFLSEDIMSKRNN